MIDISQTEEPIVQSTNIQDSISCSQTKLNEAYDPQTQPALEEQKQIKIKPKNFDLTLIFKNGEQLSISNPFFHFDASYNSL